MIARVRTKADVRALYDAMMAAEAALNAAALRDTSRLSPDEQFDARLTFERARVAYGKAFIAFEDAARAFTEAEAA